MKKLRTSTGMTQKEFAEYFNIPQKTLEKWEQETRTPPKYVTELIEYKINKEEINMNKLTNKLPKKYRDRVQDFTAEDGLIDNCKYILTFADGYTWNGYETLPCKSIAEAITFVRETEKENEYE